MRKLNKKEIAERKRNEYRPENNIDKLIATYRVKTGIPFLDAPLRPRTDELKDVNIKEEYVLIQQKKSKLSAHLRNAVILRYGKIKK